MTDKVSPSSRVTDKVSPSSRVTDNVSQAEEGQTMYHRLVE